MADEEEAEDVTSGEYLEELEEELFRYMRTKLLLGRAQPHVPCQSESRSSGSGDDTTEMEIAERPIHEVFAYERDFRIPLLPPPSIRSSADKSMDTKQGGASPKRKAEDDVMEVSEADGNGGQSPAKGARVELDQREDVEQLMHMLMRLSRRRSLSPSLKEQLRTLPREDIADIMSRVPHWKSKFRARAPPSQPTKPKEPDSDQDSGSESFSGDMYETQAKFQIPDRVKLRRLLILGTPNKAVVRNDDPAKRAQNFVIVNTMIEDDRGLEVVETIKEICTQGRSNKQDSLLYALAKCCRCTDQDTKRAAYAAIQDIARTPTQLFQLIRYIENLEESTGWGRGLRRAVSRWYNSCADNPMRLAMHVTKYWSRHEWNHRDIFRLTHIKPVNDVIGFIIRYCVKGMAEAEKMYLEDGYLGREEFKKVHEYLKAVEEVKQSQDAKKTVQLITEHHLVREHMRTEMLNNREVWEALLKEMPLTALIRNLGKMTTLDMFNNPLNVKIVMEKLSNVEAMKKARIHPFKILLAHHIYSQGQGEKGHLNWSLKINREILKSLDKAFYQSFQAVEPTNKKILIALDISGSMGSVMQNSPITNREAAAVMAMVTVRREPSCEVVGFNNQLQTLDHIFKDDTKTVEELVQATSMLGFGMTDCSKPMTWARKHNKEFDAFIIYTDSETNSHSIPPWAALQKYRNKMNKPTAKLIVVGMSSFDFTIARPDDVHMLDVVGFDPDTPDMIREFILGNLE